MRLTTDCTLILGIDRHTIQQLYLTAHTWMKHRPILFQMPWLVFYDQQEVPRQALDVLKGWLGRVDIKLFPWPATGCPGYPTQREKMLTGHLYVAAEQIKTNWSLKLDTDAIAVDGVNPWPLDEWFSKDPCLIGNPWGYTRAKGGGGMIRDWINTLEDLGDRFFPDTDRLFNGATIKPWPGDPTKDKLMFPRLASWICFQRTDWMQRIASRLHDKVGRYQLPLPSADTTLWYLAHRSGAHYHRVNMRKQCQWTNHARLSSIEKRVKQVMGWAEKAIA